MPGGQAFRVLMLSGRMATTACMCMYAGKRVFTVVVRKVVLRRAMSDLACTSIGVYLRGHGCWKR